MISDVRYRPMEEADLEGVAALEAASFPNPWPQNVFADALINANYCYYVAAVHNEIIATAGYIYCYDYGDLTNVATAAAYRRQGIAEHLLLTLMEAGIRRGLEVFTLDVRAQNAPAIALYEKLGFTRRGCRKRYYTNPVDDALIYRKEIC